mmetsp:Transcript_18702/g.39270  ORF Transcript_18702/g.39270 Transcript_18702/m.39270 type:complete len:80 (+) Transcript_18702:549-788(+)
MLIWMTRIPQREEVISTTTFDDQLFDEYISLYYGGGHGILYGTKSPPFYLTDFPFPHLRDEVATLVAERLAAKHDRVGF